MSDTNITTDPVTDPVITDPVTNPDTSSLSSLSSDAEGAGGLLDLGALTEYLQQFQEIYTLLSELGLF